MVPEMKTQPNRVSPDDYEQLTRSAYRSDARALAYRRHQKEEWSWARFVTGFEQRIIRRWLNRYTWAPTDLMLDVPCGTGVLGPLLAAYPFRVAGSDISAEMMRAGRDEYRPDQCCGLAQADITRLPFVPGTIAGVMTLGFMHRVPAAVRQGALAEIARLQPRMIIVTYSLDTRVQRVKKAVLSALRPKYVPAPQPATRAVVDAEIAACGLRVVAVTPILPGLSAEYLFLLEPQRRP